ncbi:MAG: hypothetical protein HQL31_02220 [Planctomycetes bacterium]|nr:hypothetical protein [Planctomycetota bacterium]
MSQEVDYIRIVLCKAKDRQMEDTPQINQRWIVLRKGKRVIVTVQEEKKNCYLCKNEEGETVTAPIETFLEKFNPKLITEKSVQSKPVKKQSSSDFSFHIGQTVYSSKAKKSGTIEVIEGDSAEVHFLGSPNSKPGEPRYRKCKLSDLQACDYVKTTKIPRKGNTNWGPSFIGGAYAPKRNPYENPPRR